MNICAVAEWITLEDRKPVHALVSDVDLVVTRFDDQVTALSPGVRVSGFGQAVLGSIVLTVLNLLALMLLGID